MIYLTLHQTQSDYDSLVLDDTNTPHVAYIIDTNDVYFTDVISSVPEGYQAFKLGDEELIDSEGKQFLVTE